MDKLPDRYPYQEYMFQQILRRKKTAVIGKPGCGKTRPIIDALVELGCIRKKWLGITHLEVDHKQINVRAKMFPKGSIFVMGSGPSIATWLKQFPQWVNDPSLKDYIHVVRGPKHKRLQMWKQAYKKNEPGIYITNFAVYRIDQHVIRQVQWAAVVADEYHKVMRRRQSQTFKFFRSWTKHQEIMILATGSVISKDPGSMWTAFTLVEPTLKLFRSYWRYLKTFCLMQEGAYGQEILGIKNVEALKEIMDRYFAYVPAAVIADQQPDGLRQAIDAEMTPEQDKIYEEITQDMIATLEDGGIVIAPTAMAKLLILRQLLCCPRILDESLGMGGGYELILEKLEDQPHMIIFVPFRPAVRYIAEALRSKGYTVDMMLGGVGHVEQAEILDRFRLHRSIIVCTIAYAESFDCETCDTSYFLGYDFNIDPNAQAEGRTQRAISEHKFVTWNYIRHRNTVDEIMLMNLEQDMNNVNKVLRRPAELIAALKGEVYHDTQK